MLVDNSDARHAVKRVLDYCSTATPWPRRLWRLGTLLELEELAEASVARHNGALSDSSVKYLADGLARRVRHDRGIGSDARRGQVIDHIKRTLAPNGHDQHALRLLRTELSENYLRNWANALRVQAVPVESLSRAVASHLLDAGFSPTYLNKWFTYFCSHAPQELSVPDLIELAASLPARPLIRYQALIPVVAAPPMVGAPPGWLDATGTSQWLAEWYPNRGGIRQSGALLLDVDARDTYSAIDRVRNTLERLVARFRVGARKTLRFHSEAFLISEAEPFSLAVGPRRVDVRALERTGVIFDLRLPSQVDAALELLEPLDSSAPAAAVAGSWAAIETLLVGPGDTSNRVVAATRMARIVACSYLRSEFTALANAHVTESNDDLAVLMRTMTENKEKAEYLEGLFRTGREPSFAGERHQLASRRLREVVDNPSRVLDRIVQQLEDAFRRLYRQRNLIVHAGQTSSVALDGCLRTVAPLVGAGTDRIVHASALRGISPLELSAQAEVRLHQARAGECGFVGMLP